MGLGGEGVGGLGIGGMAANTLEEAITRSKRIYPLVEFECEERWSLVVLGLKDSRRKILFPLPKDLLLVELCASWLVSFIGLIGLVSSVSIEREETLEDERERGGE